jgi:replicative DNA helicase
LKNTISINDILETKKDEGSLYNIEAEQLVIGNLLTNNEALNLVNDFLQEEHFFEPLHQQIFNIINQYFDKGIVATPITLKNHFNADPENVEYLNKLGSLASAAIEIKDYARILNDLFLKRQLVEIGKNTIVSANEQDSERIIDAHQQIEDAEASLFNLANENSISKSFEKLSDTIKTSLENVQKSLNQTGISGVSTNLLDLDKLLGGIQNSDLLILAGRPSMGKTALALNMALNVAENFHRVSQSENTQPQSVAFFSLEMSSEQLANRLIAIKSKVNSKKFRSGNLTNQDFEAIVKSSKNLNSLPLYIDDTPAITISAARTRARRLKRKNNLGLIVIDYLQLMRGSQHNRENRVQEISEITQGLKAIAKELNLPVIALSQLSRAVEQRENKRPQLSDLRESGTIEQDSDIVMFIYREQYYIERLKPSETSKEMQKWQELMSAVLNKADVIIAKQRHGPIGNVTLRFDPNTTEFNNIAQE